MPNRRAFILGAIPLAMIDLAMIDPLQARADAPTGVRVQESDPIAMALGYRADATRVDRAKFPTYGPGHRCGTCQLFQGAAGARWGACPIMGNKLVSTQGWCSAWAQKS